MIKGYSPRANRILSVLIQDEAKRRHADQLLPEHLLICVFKEGSGTACRILRSLQADPVSAEVELEKALVSRKGAFVLGDLPPSRRLRVLLETAGRRPRPWARIHRHEHLLLAASDEEGSPFSAFLRNKASTPSASAGYPGAPAARSEAVRHDFGRKKPATVGQSRSPCWTSIPAT
jgi:ATP-dependent Clp protease ATP-binding subunit ClpC